MSEIVDKPEIEETDLPEEKKDENVTEHEIVFNPVEYHEWHQEANQIICTSCPYRHAAAIPIDKILSKDSAGNFILVSIEDDAKARAITG
jgi:hypothetical protein